jgi:hypothetical protein
MAGGTTTPTKVVRSAEDDAALDGITRAISPLALNSVEWSKASVHGRAWG